MNSKATSSPRDAAASTQDEAISEPAQPCSDIRTRVPSVEENTTAFSDSPRLLVVFCLSAIAQKSIAISSQYNIIVKVATNIEDFQRELANILDNNPAAGTTELWLLHMFLVDSNNQPMIGGQTVTENQFYGLLCGKGFQKSHVVQLVYRLPQNTKMMRPNTPSQGESAKVPAFPILSAPDQRPGTAESPKRVACSGTYFHLLDISKGTRWSDVHDAINHAVRALEEESTLTAGEVVRLMTEHCPGLKLLQWSGLPDGEISDPPLERRNPWSDASGPPQMQEDLAQGIHDDLFVKRPTELSDKTEQLQCEELDQQQQHRDHPEHHGHQRQALPPVNTHSEGPLRSKSPILGIGISIFNYKDKDSSQWVVRQGGQNDNKLIREILHRFRCHNANSHLISNDQNRGRVNRQNIDTFLAGIVEKYKLMGALCQIFLFISAHGNKEGILTSVGEIVSLADLMKPLLPIARHLVGIYQACRGDLFHSVGQVSNPELLGLSHPGFDTIGCCLAPLVENCSIIYGSMPGYFGYRRESEGSLLLIALHKAVHEPNLSGRVISVHALAELTQKELLTMHPDGLVVELHNEQRTHLIQLQFAERGNCRTEIADSKFCPNGPTVERRLVWKEKILQLPVSERAATKDEEE